MRLPHHADNPVRIIGRRAHGAFRPEERRKRMFDVKKVETQWGGETLTLETGKVARQADGAVLAQLGDTVVLCAVTAAKSVREGQDFFPLTVP